jgi:hypothetical protein
MRGLRGRPQAAAALTLLASFHLLRSIVVGLDVHYVGVLSGIAAAITFACAWQLARVDDDVSLMCGTAAALASFVAYTAALWLGLPGQDATHPTVVVVAVLVMSAVAAAMCGVPLVARVVRRPRRLRTRLPVHRVAQARAATKRVA